MVYDPRAEHPTGGAKGAKPRKRKRSRRSKGAGPMERVADHPWMSWMQRELAGHAMDICHIVAPGELAGGEATLVIPAAPVLKDAEGAAPRVPAPRLVTAPYLAAVLELVGAPAALLGLTAGPISRIAGRALGDDLARRRPSMLAVHDLDRDTNCREVESIYRFFATRAPSRPPFGSNVTVFCHPAQVIEMPDVPTELDASMQEALRGARDAARQLVDRTEPTPAWFAAAQRLLEQSVGEYLAQRPVGDRALAEHEGTRKAIEVASRVLARPETIEAATREPGRSR